MTRSARLARVLAAAPTTSSSSSTIFLSSSPSSFVDATSSRNRTRCGTTATASLHQQRRSLAATATAAAALEGAPPGSTLVPAAVATRPFRRVLVANRGEIAIRICRALKELDIVSVCVYARHDAEAAHVTKCDEAYEVGDADDTPVGAYLNCRALLDVAKQQRCDAIHPGYGFLSERGDFAAMCQAEGIKWIGPDPAVVDKMGNKTAARALAIASDVPVIPGTDDAISTFAEATAWTDTHGFPVMIKAAFGGGGRGMRVVRSADEFEESFSLATSEALAAFGDGTVFLERYVERPRHIEVQVLGDEHGELVHLFERDCSVQRRHQKVVETAPAPNFSQALRDALTADALKLCRAAGYSNAGTVEFLLDNEDRHYFIEVNARLQVEHTVTEVITGVDLVQAQIRVAEGQPLTALSLTQSDIGMSGAAIQCRITTEDAAHGFKPDAGVMTTYETPGGSGVRLDGGSAFHGAVVSPHYDSLLVKITCSARSHAEAAAKMSRALTEFRIHGVQSNIPFLLKVMAHPLFVSGTYDTAFIDTTPSLFDFRHLEDTAIAQKLIQYAGELVVNGPMTLLGNADAAPSRVQATLPDAATLAAGAAAAAQAMASATTTPSSPSTPSTSKPPSLRSILKSKGPDAFAAAVRQHRRTKGLLLTDTTWRDAHQSLLATRVRTRDIAAIAPATGVLLPHLYSSEMWGGATFDVALRFLRECPWERLATLRELMPDVPFQMLLRGANAVGYKSYADATVRDFCRLSVEHGMDVFRVFDSLNYYDNLRFGMDAVGEAGGVVEAAIAYTGDVSVSSATTSTQQARGLYDMDYYLKLADKLVTDGGAHVLCVKDMAGLLKPRAATELVSRLRAQHPDTPIHVHTHDTSGNGVAAMLRAAEAGADVVDVAIDSMSGMTSQPSMGAVVAALEGTECDTGTALSSVATLSSYWEVTREQYTPFECTSTMKTGDSSVYQHEIPGGQYTNMAFQAHALGLSHKWPEIKRAYAAANTLLGDLIKVTPSSKVVGDLAQFMVSNALTADDVVARAAELDFPASVMDFFRGDLGVPVGGFPEPLTTRALRGEQQIQGRPGLSVPEVDLVTVRAQLQEQHPTLDISEADAMSWSMYPAVFEDYCHFKAKYGDVSRIPTANYLVPLEKQEEMTLQLRRGQTRTIKYISQGNFDAHTGTKRVYFQLNGMPRSVVVLDKAAAQRLNLRSKAVESDVGSVGAPMPGTVVSVTAVVGDVVAKGDRLLVLSAMKMETVVTAPCDGVVTALTVTQGDDVQPQDLCVQITPA